MWNYPIDRLASMNSLTLIYPYYCNPDTLAYHARHWASLPRWVRQVLHVRVVDDGSPIPAERVLANERTNTELYRIKKDKPWNQHGARNLGAHVAVSDDDWLLMTDMDMFVPEQVVCYLLQARLDGRVHYTFRREAADGRIWKPHFNTFLVTKRNFWKAGGYDEDFCGSYGGDGLFVKALKRVAPAVPLSQTLIGLSNHITDCNTSAFGRKDSEYRREYLRRLEAKVAMGPGGLLPRDPLRFDWERVW